MKMDTSSGEQGTRRLPRSFTLNEHTFYWVTIPIPKDMTPSNSTLWLLYHSSGEGVDYGHKKSMFEIKLSILQSAKRYIFKKLLNLKEGKPVTWKDQVREMISRVEKGMINDRAWISHGSLRAYIRITKRHLKGKKLNTVDLASVEVLKKDRGSGIFTEWLKDLEELAEQHKRALFVESILEPKLIPFLLKRGYISVPNGLFKIPKG